MDVVDDGQRTTLSCNDQELFSEEMVSGEMFWDLPPDSFWVPEGYEKDWVDHHAVMQRKSSMKLISFTGRNSNRNFESYSHRFSPSLNQKSKASLVGLPRTQKSGLLDGNFRQNKSGNARLFRSLSEPGGNVILDVHEPGSPKVSCTGRVENKQKGRVKRTGTGLWSSFKSVLRTGFGVNMLVNKGNALSTA
ncbi:hypothetical protein ACH5RR_016494 [Cinchona calisaya]|uniref:Uncharacterized protein n=1 Tax=Cinchona calisaya TaxID=153742 RepID=A0ABD2ZZ92_9GENT